MTRGMRAFMQVAGAFCAAAAAIVTLAGQHFNAAGLLVLSFVDFYLAAKEEKPHDGE